MYVLYTMSMDSKVSQVNIFRNKQMS